MGATDNTPLKSLTWHWTVDPAHVGKRLDLAIALAMEARLGHWEGDSESKTLPHPLSRNQVQRLIDEQQISIFEPKVAVLSSTKVQAGQRVQVIIPAPTSLELTPKDIPIEILFQDEHLVIINKPPGLTVHPSETQRENTLVHALLHHIRDLSGIGGKLRPGIVHRLDKDTSGALVVTKTDAAHQKMVETFSRHDIERRYWALCYGVPRDQYLKIQSTLGRSPSDRKKMAMNVKDGKEAITEARLLERYGKPTPYASLIEAQLHTGRTHQVRVHLTSIGTSIMGDPVYGTPTAQQAKWKALPRDLQQAIEALPGQALHARVLGFKHPITGEALRFEAPPPPAFALLLAKLKEYAIHPA